MDGIAAKSMSMMLRSRGLEGRELTPLVGQVDRLLNTPAVADKFLSGDFGRLLQAQGLSILQERVDLTAKSRMDRSYALFQRAVFYNPDQHEAWMNLAMISFKRGDCAAAARFADRAVDTYADNKDSHRKSIEAVASSMKKLSLDPQACRTAAAEFHPYPGL
jgi:tetratricopeptide (TPR) repeat protein